jgi:hypothetical protein
LAALMATLLGLALCKTVGVLWKQAKVSDVLNQGYFPVSLLFLFTHTQTHTHTHTHTDTHTLSLSLSPLAPIGDSQSRCNVKFHLKSLINSQRTSCFSFVWCFFLTMKV